jgi:flagellar basal body-associated protein FliL
MRGFFLQEQDFKQLTKTNMSKKKIIIIVVVLLLLAGAAYWYWNVYKKKNQVKTLPVSIPTVPAQEVAATN